MKSIAGLWIDHRKAVIVIISDARRRNETDRIRHGEACPIFWRF